MSVRARALVIVLLSAPAVRSAEAQEALFELPPTAGLLVTADRADLERPLRAGAQLAFDLGERMPFSPGVSLLLRPVALRPPGRLAAFGQLGIALRAPAHGTPRQAGERALNLGSALLLEPAVGSAFLVVEALRLEGRLFLRLEQQLAETDRAETDDSQRVAPLVAAAGAQLGIALGPWVNAAELSLGTRIRAGGGSPEYMDVVERVPRLRLSSTLRVWSHTQVFLDVLPLDGAFTSRSTWTFGVAGNLAVDDD